jgi:hypothetical protein
MTGLSGGVACALFLPSSHLGQGRAGRQAGRCPIQSQVTLRCVHMLLQLYICLNACSVLFLSTATVTTTGPRSPGAPSLPFFFPVTSLSLSLSLSQKRVPASRPLPGFRPPAACFLLRLSPLLQASGPAAGRDDGATSLHGPPAPRAFLSARLAGSIDRAP